MGEIQNHKKTNKNIYKKIYVKRKGKEDVEISLSSSLMRCSSSSPVTTLSTKPIIIPSLACNHTKEEENIGWRRRSRLQREVTSEVGSLKRANPRKRWKIQNHKKTNKNIYKKIYVKRKGKEDVEISLLIIEVFKILFWEVNYVLK